MQNTENEIIIVEEENNLVIRLSKEYELDGKKIKEIDLSNLENITARDMIKAENKVKLSNRTEFLPELTLEYSLWIAYYATKIPIEFFLNLNFKDSRSVKVAIENFFI